MGTHVVWRIPFEVSLERVLVLEVLLACRTLPSRGNGRRSVLLGSVTSCEMLQEGRDLCVHVSFAT
jgi:hypothetical protein